MSDPKSRLELKEINGILSGHKDMDFVKRIAFPEAFPKLYDNENGVLGQASTHSMAAEVDADGDWFVYPTVVNQPGAPGLRRLNHEEAFDYAEKTGERIPFGKDADKALWFSQKYKKVWENE